MLFCSAIYRDAAKRLPFWEARLAFFANGNPNTQNTQEEEQKEVEVDEDGNPIEGQKKETRQSAQDTMEKPEAVDSAESYSAETDGMQGNVVEVPPTLRAGEVHNNVEALKLEVSTMHEKMQELDSFARKVLPKEYDRDLRDIWVEDETLLSLQGANLAQLEKTANTLREFASGALHPREIGRTLEESFLTMGQNTDMENRSEATLDYTLLKDAKREIGAIIGKELATLNQGMGGSITFETANTATKQQIANTVIESPYFQSILAMIEGNTQIVKKIIEDSKMQELIEHVEEAKQEKYPKTEENIPQVAEGQSLGAMFAKLKEGIGIEFLSINNIINSGKTAWEAFSKSWQRKEGIKEAIFAKQMGAFFKWLPNGKQAMEILQDTLDKGDEEEVKEFQEYLERRHIGYLDLRYSILPANKHNTNRVRGIVRYAADQGWLYDFDKETGHVFGGAIDVGKYATVAAADDPRGEARKKYIDDMFQQNAKGTQDAIERGKNMTKGRENIPLIVKDIEHQMRNCNFFIAIGMMEVALAKGKTGEGSAWIFTAFLRILRENPEIRSLVTESMLDQTPGLGMSNFTSRELKLNRITLNKWAHGKMEFKDTSHIANAMHAAEEQIKKNTGRSFDKNEKERAELAHMVARVLATQTVDLAPHGGSGTISIFENGLGNAFSEYREYMSVPPAGYTASVDVKGADEDVYGLESEVPLLNLEAIKDILSFKSQGGFEYESKASNFLARLMTISQDLNEQYQNEKDPLKKQRYKEAMENFRSETRHKMNAYIKDACSNANAQRIAATLAYTKRSKKSGEPALAGLFMPDRALADPSILNKPEIAETKLAKALKRQIQGASADTPEDMSTMQDYTIPITPQRQGNENQDTRQENEAPNFDTSA